MAEVKRQTLSRDDFEFWLLDMDDQLESFALAVPANLRAKLDYSPRSLDELERWLIDRYSSHTDLLKPEAALILDGASRYIGEVFRKRIGGRWDIRLDDPKYAYYAMPQLTGFAAKSTPICPVSLTTASINRRTGNYLHGILNNMEKRYSPLSA